MKNKTYLITGGTGSLGKRLTLHIQNNLNPKKIKIFSRDEQKQFNMSIDDQFNHNKVDFYLGDIRNLSRVYEIIKDVDIVVHTAALKHVHFGEKNPEEFIDTNILGTRNLIKASIDNNVEKVLFVSTDKSVYPLNLYGATKLIAEKLILNQNLQKKKTIFSVVRYGNVAGSKGSVIPTFLKIIKNSNNYIELRDEKITRFWITFDEAIQCIIYSLKDMVGGEVFIPKMKSFFIKDLTQILAIKNKVKITKLKPGEKMHESLSTFEDSDLILEYKNYFKILSSYEQLNSELRKNKNAKKLSKNFCYSSDKNKNFLDKKDLNKLLNSIDIEN